MSRTELKMEKVKHYYYYWRIDSDISGVLYTHTHRVQTLYLRHVWVSVWVGVIAMLALSSSTVLFSSTLLLLLLLLAD